MGGLDLVVEGRNLTPTAPKHRDLLAVLALNAGRPLTVERLRRMLWPAEDGDRSDSLIRGYVGRLRGVIGKDAIANVPGGYVLNVPDDRFDVARFRWLVQESAHDAERAPEMLREALALWRGQVLEDVDPDGTRWRETGRLRRELEELRLFALERRIELDLDAGRHRELLGELRRLVEEHPTWQRFRGLLMLALYRSGRRVEALEAYAELRTELDEGHAIVPDPDLQLLYHRMLHDDVSLHVSVGPPVLLPYDVADFAGREDQMSRLAELLDRPSPVVIHGMAGVGKSALAVHAAWTYRTRFPDGILYADLRGRPGDAGTASALLEDFLRWLGCPAPAIPAALERREQLFRAYTAGRRMLVLLDNATSEEQVRPLLTSCATVVTSRSPLGGLTEAVRLPVAELPHRDAVDLLRRLIGQDRTRDPAPVHRLGELCEGLPLAVRIAGARLASRPGWTVDYLADLLEDERARLDHLRSGGRSVRGVYAIGYEDLPGDARRLLRRLGALPATGISDWIADHLGGGADVLVEAGLLETVGVDEAGQLRHRMHDLTRLYARERLVDEEGEDAVRRVLAALAPVVLARVRASRFLPVSRPEQPFTTIDVRESVNWLLAERAFLVGLTGDLHAHGLREEAFRLAHLLPPFFERHAFLDDWDRTSRVALDAAPDDRAAASALRDRGDLHRARGEWEAAHECLRRALATCLRLGDTRGVAQVRRRLGQVHLEQGRLGDAERNLAACLAELGGRDADAHRAFGLVAHRTGRHELAERNLELAIGLLAELGDRHRRADCLLDLAAVRLSRGLLPEAHALAQEARTIAARLADRRLDARALATLADVARAEGLSRRAGDLAAEAAARYAGIRGR
ncbi:AfsR/SARP family transcriptional regulator [Thermoactinospora rubra]|uniref:AfsR/SARP family transcriptional regulator n=1 Tax=Thermoactinospora rubra TaxID=1088767 RepID=UPI0013019CF4|nr:AfsR/SARP family transcriptional regulator [Thermoactinospora rubra]